MRRLSLITAALVLMPLVAQAHEFRWAQDVILPVTLEGPRTVRLEQEKDDTWAVARIVNQKGVAVGIRRTVEKKNLMEGVKILKAPKAADTEKPTTPEMLIDGNPNTSFRPASTTRFTILLEFPESIDPTDLAYPLDGWLTDVTVRFGNDRNNLRTMILNSFGIHSALSGERGKFFELTFSFQQGHGAPVLDEITFTRNTDYYYFQALPGEQYVLLTGTSLYVDEMPQDHSLKFENVIDASHGPKRTPSEEELGDNDGIDPDNCPLLWNPKQEDYDEDGLGDVCDICVYLPDPQQTDTDHDGVGDVCEDNDADGVENAIDNCPALFNSHQEDEDRDGQGNVCDNVDNRFTAGKPWLLWGALVLVILMLGGAGAMVLRRTSGEK